MMLIVEMKVTIGATGSEAGDDQRLLMAMLCVRTSEARHGVLDLEVSSSKLMCQSKQRRTLLSSPTI